MCCHPERSEGSVSMGREMLRCAQHDRTGFGRENSSWGTWSGKGWNFRVAVINIFTHAVYHASGWTVKISLVGKQGVCYDRTNKSRNRLARGRSDNTEETGH